MPESARRAWEAEDRAWNKMAYGIGETPEDRLAKRMEHLERRLTEVEANHYHLRVGLENKILMTIVLLCCYVCLFVGTCFFLRWLWFYVKDR